MVVRAVPKPASPERPVTGGDVRVTGFRSQLDLGRGMLGGMADVTRILAAIESGDAAAAGQLLPLVYEELRRLAARRLSQEQAGQTLQATALVHEAYLRLVANPGGASSGEPGFDGRGHFFAAAAEAMRRILVEKARHRKRLRHGGDRRREPLDENEPALAAAVDPVDLLALDEALARLEAASPRRAQLVKLRYFVGLTLPEAAELIGVSRSTAEADWTYAKAWLKREMEKG
jgi:RNA polymerase sigma factor (TIGR02999 family)